MPKRTSRDGVQLSMFEPAHKLMGMSSMDALAFGGKVDPVAGHKAMVKSKRMDNQNQRYGDLEASVRAEGVHQPVQIVHGNTDDWLQGKGGRRGHDIGVMHIGNGHHRMVAAYDANPNMEVPVVHHEQFRDFVDTGAKQDPDFF